MPKLRLLESILQPIINRLPTDVFALIPRSLTRKKGWQFEFPDNKPLIAMTHVCRSWRNVLVSTPSLWTQIDFSMSAESQQAEGFLRRSGDQMLDIYQDLGGQDHIEPFLSATLHNLFRLEGLTICSSLYHLEPLLRNFSASAPELKHLEIQNNSVVEADTKLPKMFGGRMPKLTSLSLFWFRTNLRDLNLPSLTRFSFVTAAKISNRDLISFFERCALLEFIQISLSYPPQKPAPPPRRRVCLAALQELRLDKTACTTGLLDRLILPKCTERMLKGEFTGEAISAHGTPAAQILASSLDHLPVTRGMTKAVVMQSSCTFSGPSGNLSFWWFEGTRENVDAHFFTSFFPISVRQIRELWIGQRTVSYFRSDRTSWEHTAAGLREAFEVLPNVEDLSIVGCKMEPFFQALGATVDGGIFLPGLRKLVIYVGCGEMDASALIRCIKARKERFRPVGEVVVVWEKDPGVDAKREMESLREFVGELVYCVDKAPKLFWRGEENGWWV